MANTKISALTTATIPAVGSEVLPIVQSSATKQISIANLTAGRSVSGTSFVPSGSTIPANGLYLPAANAVGIATNSTQAFLANAVQGIQILNTLGVGATTPATTGAGISFPATQSASSDANTLDDYEEGTWTPVLSASVTAPTVSVYLNQTGVYTKVGNLVVATCYIRATITNVGSGYPIITGLPFSASNLEGVACGFNTLANNVSSSTGGWYVNGTAVYTAGTTMTYAITSGYFTFTVSYKV